MDSRCANSAAGTYMPRIPEAGGKCPTNKRVYPLRRRAARARGHPSRPARSIPTFRTLRAACRLLQKSRARALVGAGAHRRMFHPGARAGGCAKAASRTPGSGTSGPPSPVGYRATAFARLPCQAEAPQGRRLVDAAGIEPMANTMSTYPLSCASAALKWPGYFIVPDKRNRR